MHLLIQYPAGVIVEGVVLAAGKNRMRIAARGFTDTLELKRRGEHWVANGRETVELEFLMARPCNTPKLAIPVMMAAGSADFACLPC
ncbi:MAG TPA: hypothetical protein VMB03_27960 [Bryobacteraceae bacterium]|nr:hypothetical protein [Bryobacteraceae bacterium]